MKNKLQKPYLSPEKYFITHFNKTSSNDKFAFLSGFIVCLAVNMFVYTNTCFVHDSLRMYDDSDYFSNGRILLSPMLGLLNHMQIPWIIGLVTSVIIGFVVVFIAKIFKLNSKLSSIILAGIVVTSDTLVVSHAYFNYVYIYSFSLLLSVLAVYFTDKEKHGYILSMVLLCISIFMYQAYLATAVSLYVYKLIFELVENEDNSLIQRLKRIAKYIFIVLVSSSIYYIIWKIVIRSADSQMSGYYAYSGIESAKTVSDLLDVFINTFANTLFQLFPFYGLSNVYPLKFIVSALTVIALITLALKQKRVVNIFLYLIYVLTYIFSVNLIYFLSGSVTYELTMFSYILPMVSLLYIIDNKIISKTELQNRFNWVVCVLSIVLIAGQTVYANSVYLKLKTNYDNAWSYATRIVDRLEQTEGFNKDSKVAVINYDYDIGGFTYKAGDYPINEDIQRALKYTSGYKTKTTLYCLMNAITYPKSLEWFITQEMDMAINIETNPEELIETSDVRNMGVFPDANSVKWVGDTLVVKVG